MTCYLVRKEHVMTNTFRLRRRQRMQPCCATAQEFNRCAPGQQRHLHRWDGSDCCTPVEAFHRKTHCRKATARMFVLDQSVRDMISTDQRVRSAPEGGMSTDRPGCHEIRLWVQAVCRIEGGLHSQETCARMMQDEGPCTLAQKRGTVSASTGKEMVTKHQIIVASCMRWDCAHPRD